MRVAAPLYFCLPCAAQGLDPRQRSSSPPPIPGPLTTATIRAGATASSTRSIVECRYTHAGLGFPDEQFMPRASKSTPLLVNGVLYFTEPDNIWAVDARTGRQIWHYHTTTMKAITSAIAA